MFFVYAFSIAVVVITISIWGSFAWLYWRMSRLDDDFALYMSRNRSLLPVARIFDTPLYVRVNQRNKDLLTILRFLYIFGMVVTGLILLGVLYRWRQNFLIMAGVTIFLIVQYKWVYNRYYKKRR